MPTFAPCNSVKKPLLTALLPSLVLTAALFVTSMPATADVVAATVAVGNGPNAVAINPSTNRIYVANGLSNTVTVIDGATNSTATIAVGNGPNAVAVNPSTNQVYVTNSLSNTVTVIDGATNGTTTVAVGASPVALAINSNTNRIYVANNGSADVTVIDGATNNTATIAVGNGPDAVAVNPVTNKVYVASPGNNTVSVINDANKVIATLTIYGPSTLAINATTNKIYVADNGYYVVKIIDGATEAVTSGGDTVCCASDSVEEIAINSVTNRLYMPNASRGRMHVMDGATNAITMLYLQGYYQGAIAINSASDKIYVLNNGSANVTVIEGATNNYTKIAVGNYPRALAVNPVTNKVYVANVWSNDVTVIDGAATTTPPATTISLTSNSNNIRYGDTVTFTAAVSGVSPTGSVAFQDGGVTITACAAQTLQAGTATCTLSAQTLAFGDHVFTATYSNDGINVAGSSAWLRRSVSRAYATTTLTSSSNPSNFGSSVTFAATVSSAWSPTGTVTFSENSVPIDGCAAVPLVEGTATCTTATLSAGSHQVYAGYSGDSINDSNLTSFTQYVNSAPLAPTSTSIVSSSNPSKYHNNVTFTATVTGGTPTGLVAFKDGGVNIVGCTEQVISAGTATCTVNTLTIGSHAITASYLGDTTYAASTSPILTQSVLKRLPK